MPRCSRKDGEACPPLMSSELAELCAPELMDFWEGLGMQQRRGLLTIDKRELFQAIRSKYCSRCFGLFQLRWDELKSAPSDNPCPACSEYFCSLQVQPDGHTLTLEDSILQRHPFSTFLEAKRRERERMLQYAGTGVLICGNEWTRSPGNSMCNLHTSNVPVEELMEYWTTLPAEPRTARFQLQGRGLERCLAELSNAKAALHKVPVEALMEYWTNLPEEHRTALFQLRDEDFAAELDAHLKYQLRICKDCRGNVTRAFRELRASKTGAPGEEMEVCEGHNLSVADGMVTLLGEGDPSFFERAEEVEEFKGGDGDVDDGYSEGLRHAETPELAREALADCAILIFKGQVEVAFREQTAGHNALLLFVHLALTIMEARLENAYKDLNAKKAEAELMEMVAKDEAKEPKKAKKKGKKKGSKGEGRGEGTPLCGCGAPIDQCDRCSARSKSPFRGGAPSLPAKGTKSPATSPGKDSALEEGEGPPMQEQHSSPKPAMQSPNRSTLGADLVTTPRRSPPAQDVSPTAALPGGSWETIHAGGKGRRSSMGGARKAPQPQPAAEHAQHAARAAAAAAPPAHQHKAGAPALQEHQDGPAPGHQHRQHVRAIPVSTLPPHSTKAGALGSGPALSSSLSEVHSPSAGSPASSHSLHVAARHAPIRAGSYLSRASENAAVTPDIKQDPQVAWKSSNPWRNKPAPQAQAAFSGAKLPDQAVHAVHAYSVAWPPPPPPEPQQASGTQGLHDAFSLFYHSPLARQSAAIEREASSTPETNQPPSYNLWGPSTPLQQAPMPVLHVVR